MFTFEAASILTPEEATQAKTYAQQFMEIMNAADVEPDLAEAS